MTIEAERTETEQRVARIPGQAPPSKAESVPFNLTRVVTLIAVPGYGAGARPTISPEEMTAVTSRRETAGQLLAAALLQKFVEGGAPQTPTQEPTEPHGLTAYLARDRAGEELSALSRHSPEPLPKGYKERRRPQLEAVQKLNAPGAQAFERFLAVAREADDTFTAEYTTADGKPDRAKIITLYDATDDLGHPLLAGVPDISSCRDDARRDAAVNTDRIIRVILNQAFPPAVA